ncbi:GerAB/ArcD/ProY family transporter [Paenibacillus humicola]|uniref:GerAB/ArcD/ProY family transporter n=1 Tax=Paenibacillus humicola TaxID=3110540 RepID=UPI00237B8514|nr:GerAB/ArcD/ProY family transporter [Paenibacillus humicola]
MNASDSNRFTVSPYLIFVVIQSMQFGLGFVSMSVKPIRLAGQDAWVSVILCAIGIHIVLFMMYRILNHNETDLIQIHQQFFGKWAGGGLNLLFILYFLMISIYQLRVFIEVIQVWIFPEQKTWPLALALLLLAYYMVAGGFRVIVGICLCSFINHILFISMVFTAPFLHFNNLLPVMDHSPSEIIKAAKELTFSYMGVEILLFCYSFIKSPKKSQKWAHWAIVGMTILYIVEILFTLLLFKSEQLSTEIWPALSKYKFVQFPFIERFEFIGASATTFRLFPILCLCLWASSRVIKLTFPVKQRTALPIFLVLLFIAVCLIPDRNEIEFIQSWLSTIGVCVIFVYIPFLYVFNSIRKKVRRTT